MRNLSPILTVCILLGLLSPGPAWSLDLFCFTTGQFKTLRGQLSSGLQQPDLSTLLLASPRSSRQAPPVEQEGSKMALQLDARTRFGVSALAEAGGSQQGEDRGPAFAIGLHCQLD